MGFYWAPAGRANDWRAFGFCTQVRPPAGRHDTGRSGNRSRMRRLPSASWTRQLPDSERAPKKTALDPLEESRRTSKKKSGNTLRRHPHSVSARLPLTAIQRAPRSSSVREKRPALTRGGARVVAGPTGEGYGDINIAQHRIRSHFSRQFFCQRENCHAANRALNDGWPDLAGPPQVGCTARRRALGAATSKRGRTSKAGRRGRTNIARTRSCPWEPGVCRNQFVDGVAGLDLPAH